jgi:hypothetical protein
MDSPAYVYILELLILLRTCTILYVVGRERSSGALLSGRVSKRRIQGQERKKYCKVRILVVLDVDVVPCAT